MRWQEALDAFDQGLALGAELSAEVFYGHGVAAEETGNLSQAYSDYRRAAEMAPAWDKPQIELEHFRVRRP